MKFSAGFIVGLMFVDAVASIDRTRLKSTPKGIQIKDWNMYMGRWHQYATIHSCGWNGAIEFTDWSVNYVMSRKYPKFTILNKWRVNGVCSYTPFKCTPTSSGCYNLEDSIGGMNSGKVVIVAADNRFEKYAIRWSCSKYLLDACADYWVSVKTREPKPDQAVLHEIDRKLSDLWGVKMADMVPKVHSEPCPDHPVPHNKRDGKSRWRIY